MELPKCDVCGKDVSLEEGILSISFKEIRERQEAKREFEKTHPEPVLGVIDFLNYPDQIPWKWHHIACNEDGAYCIEATRFDDLRKALHWTIHLRDKTWFQDTNWREVIHRFYPECDTESGA